MLNIPETGGCGGPGRGRIGRENLWEVLGEDGQEDAEHREMDGKKTKAQAEEAVRFDPLLFSHPLLNAPCCLCLVPLKGKSTSRDAPSLCENGAAHTAFALPFLPSAKGLHSQRPFNLCCLCSRRSSSSWKT